MLSAPLTRADEERLWRYRNLGKALYENPTTQKQAVEEFRKARDLAPNSPREILNYGLALLRAGDVAGGIAQLEKAQKLDPKIPHTWFNLGIAFKKQAEFDRAHGPVPADGAPRAQRARHPLPAWRAAQTGQRPCRRHHASSSGRAS